MRGAVFKTKKRYSKSGMGSPKLRIQVKAGSTYEYTIRDISVCHRSSTFVADMAGV